MQENRRADLSAPMASFGLQNATSEAATERAVDQIDQIEEDLEDVSSNVAHDPDVQDELEKLKQRAEEGEQLTEEDFDDLKEKVANATFNEYKDDFPIGDDRLTEKGREAAESIGDKPAQVATYTEIAALARGDADGDGWIIYNPELGPDETKRLPGGGIITGDPDLVFDDGIPGGGGKVPGGGGGAPASPPLPGGTDDLALVPGTLADATGMPIGAGEPVPDTDDADDHVTSGTLLRNPEENGVSVKYVLGTHNFEMGAGYNQSLSTSGWVVRFNRGPGHGEAEYSLGEATYVFRAGENGWDLRKATYELTLENKGNSVPFHYVVDNENHSLDPNKSRTHTSGYPILVRFDRGGGDAPALKKIKESRRTLAVGVRPEDGLWDLFAPEEVQLASRSASPRRFESGRDDRYRSVRSARDRAAYRGSQP